MFSVSYSSLCILSRPYYNQANLTPNCSHLASRDIHMPRFNGQFPASFHLLGTSLHEMLSDLALKTSSSIFWVLSFSPKVLNIIYMLMTLKLISLP